MTNCRDCRDCRDKESAGQYPLPLPIAEFKKIKSEKFHKLINFNMRVVILWLEKGHLCKVATVEKIRYFLRYFSFFKK